jgi:hypothetical protein
VNLAKNGGNSGANKSVKEGSVAIFCNFFYYFTMQQVVTEPGQQVAQGVVQRAR